MVQKVRKKSFGLEKTLNSNNKSSPRYTTDDPTQLGPDGMERFCEDIKLEPENVAMLCIAFKMNAKNMGYFTQAEWLKGLADPEVQADTPGKLQNKLNYFYDLLNDPMSFKMIFRYVSAQVE